MRIYILFDRLRLGKPKLLTIMSFFLTFFLCLLLISFSVSKQIKNEELTMEGLLVEKTSEVTENLSRLLYKAQILSALVSYSNGDINGFENIASTLYDDAVIKNIALAPGGLISTVYPFESNEKAIGLDFFRDGAGNLEAMEARDTGQLVFGGPFDAVQGGQILVGRAPIYLTDDSGDKVFWGFAAIALRHPEALESSGLEDLGKFGNSYEIWRVNPDSGERQIISSNTAARSDDARYIEKHVEFLGSDWYFRIFPIKEWYEHTDTWFLIFIGLFISILFAAVVRSQNDMRIMKNTYENLSHTDSLTGLCNRRHFIELAYPHVERTIRLGTGAYFIIMDIDHFKRVNDTYGHLAGDDALVGIAENLKSNLRPYDLLSRYGGEEFLILATDITKENAIKLTERLRSDIENTVFKCAGYDIEITASFGVSEITDAENYHRFIEFADIALYRAKNSGRNKVVFFEHDVSRD